MTDLDDLIRTSLRERTAAAATDDSLAGRVQATGRRLRRARTAGVSALAIAVVIGAVWGWSILPGRTPQNVAASPSPNPTATVQPTTDGSVTPVPTRATPTFSPGGTVRDVTNTGEPVDYPEASLESYFASPSGNFQCTISAAGSRCTGTWDKGVEPSRKICDVDEVVEGVQVAGTKPAAWFCGSDAQSFPFLGSEGGKGVNWWDSTFGETMPAPWDHSQRLAILPYGKTLVAGDFRCTMAKTGVTCINTRSGQGFTTSRSQVDLTP